MKQWCRTEPPWRVVRYPFLTISVSRALYALEKPSTDSRSAPATLSWGYDWPGDVRELENMVHRGAILAEPSASINVRHLFAGGEKLRPSSFNADTSGALVHASAPTLGSDVIDRRRSLADELLASLTSLERIGTLLVRHAVERSGGTTSAVARPLRLRQG